MKAKLQSILKTDVNPLFFALSCAILICISFTARAWAEDLQNTVSVPMEKMMMTAQGQILLKVE
jgi:hypothetical protein